MSLSRIFGPAVVALAMSAALLACIDDPTNPIAVPLKDAGTPDAKVTPIVDASAPVDASDASEPEPLPDGAVTVVGAGLGPGGVVARSQSYTMITKTGGAPGDGQPGASQSYRLFSGLTAVTKK